MKTPITMKVAYEMILFFLGISLLFCISSASPAGRGETRPIFNYLDPNSWGEIAPLCAKGKRQSPINIIPIETVHSPSLSPLFSFYSIQNASLLCNGQIIEVAAEGKTELVIDGKSYKLLQIHWHLPSEHRINGIEFPAELHEVHKAEDGTVAVIATLYEYGEPDPIVSKIEPYIKEMYKKQKIGGRFDGDTTIPIAKFRSMLVKDMPKSYYRYNGSFTTPPCTEIITWTVISKAKTITWEQVAALRELLDKDNKKNSRPVQPLNGRVVQRFETIE